MAIETFLNGPGEKEGVEDFIEEEALFEGVPEEPIDSNTEEGETDMATPLSFLKKELCLLATAKRNLLSRDSTKYTTSGAIADVQALLKRDETAPSWQTLIKEYFTIVNSARVL